MPAADAPAAAVMLPGDVCGFTGCMHGDFAVGGGGPALDVAAARDDPPPPGLPSEVSGVRFWEQDGSAKRFPGAVRCSQLGRVDVAGLRRRDGAGVL